MAAGAAWGGGWCGAGPHSEKVATAFYPHGCLFACLLSVYSFFEAESHYITQAGFELRIFLLLPCKD